MKKSSKMISVSVLILAGQREGVIDPLCADAGLERKAIIPINGRPMLDYVLDALTNATKDTGLLPPFHISGYDASYDTRLCQSPQDNGPAGSALAAFTQNDMTSGSVSLPAIITTADHPLLSADMLRVFIKEAQDTGADFCVGLASKEIIHPTYPHVKRTYLKFSDISVSGCNLFYVATKDGIEAIRFWLQAQHYRKRPVKLASQFGWKILCDYLLGRLTLKSAFTYASKRMNIKVSPVLIPIAEAAIDVDKPSDKRLVEHILTLRNGGSNVES